VCWLLPVAVRVPADLTDIVRGYRLDPHDDPNGVSAAYRDRAQDRKSVARELGVALVIPRGCVLPLAPFAAGVVEEAVADVEPSAAAQVVLRGVEGGVAGESTGVSLVEAGAALAAVSCTDIASVAGAGTASGRGSGVLRKRCA